jgi:hypothetical protein
MSLALEFFLFLGKRGCFRPSLVLSDLALRVLLLDDVPLQTKDPKELN